MRAIPLRSSDVGALTSLRRILWRLEHVALLHEKTTAQGAPANANDAACIGAGTCTFAETCKPTLTDCFSGYVAGDVDTPSTTCPTGCVFTAAVHRTLDIIVGGKSAAEMRDGGFVTIGIASNVAVIAGLAKRAFTIALGL